MAYLILSDHQGEFDRRDLSKAMSIGRALDCEICVRDILLSRKHCRIERFNDRWIVADLGSKNGTRVANEVITRHVLNDGDVVQIGKIQVSFHAGPFVPPPANGAQRRRDSRPTDPTEALSGTVLGFQLFDMEEDSRVSGFPIPKPKPAEPASLRQDAVQSMVAQIASTSWDVASTGKKNPPPKPATKPPQEIVKRNQQIARAKAVAAVAAASNVEPAAPSTEVAAEPVDVLPESHPVVERNKSPDEPEAISTVLAVIYVVLACVIGLGSIAVIVMRSHSLDKFLGL